jgi:hypothetical protein
MKYLLATASFALLISLGATCGAFQTLQADGRVYRIGVKGGG